MGLLDQFDTALNSDKGMQALGLLAAAGPSATPMSFGQRLYGAMQQDRQRKAEEDAMKQRKMMQELQMQALMAQAQERKRAQEQEQQRRNYLGAVDSNAGPAMPVSTPQALAAGLSLPEIGALTPQKKTPKLKSVEPMMGPDGKMINVALFEDGSHKILPFGVKPDIALQNLGNRVTAIDKNAIPGGQSFNLGASPDAVMSAETSRRGQNMVDARSRDANSIANTGGKPPAGYRWKADGSLEAIPGGPAATKVGAADAKVADAKDVLDILDMAEPLLQKSTGSMAGAGIDMLLRGVGASTSGAEAAAELKALQGALISKMPKMSGPQSDKDVQLYREMAGQIGDPTLPIKTRQAAIRTIRKLNQAYAGVRAPAANGGWSIQQVQ